MKRNQYKRMTAGLRAKPGLLQAFTILNKVAPWVYGALYAFLVFGAIPYPMLLARIVMVPVGSFLLIQLASMFLEYPRPYMLFDLEPAIPEHARDPHTLPCKPVFWYTMIGLSFFFVLNNHIPGILLLIGAAGLGVIRVWGGLHFTRDVIAGIVLALIFGLLGYML